MGSTENLLIPYEPKHRNRKYKLNFFLCEVALINYFTKSMISAFEKIGCETATIPINEYNTMIQSLHSSKSGDDKQCDFYVSYNAFNTGYSSLFDTSALITVCIDRAYHLKHARNLDIKNIIYTWISQRDMLNANKYIKCGSHAFLPHAASVLFDSSEIFNKKRTKDVLLACSPYMETRFHQYSKKYDRELTDKIYDVYINSNQSLEECIKALTSFDDLQITQFIWEDGKVMDAIPRSDYKVKAVETLVKTGFYVHCYGLYWETTDIFKKENFISYGWKTPYDIHKSFDDVKIVVNSMLPSFGGSHERVFDSMVRGALCITTPSDYLRENFIDGENIVFYDPLNLNDLVEKVRYYLEHEDERIRITHNAFEAVCAKHTWYHRADELLDIYEDYLEQKRETES